MNIIFSENSVLEFIGKHRSLSVNRDSYLEHITMILSKL